MSSKVVFAALSVLAIAAGVSAQSGAYQQCGGKGWSGATTCVDGFYCYTQGEYYSQCIPGSSPSTSKTSVTTSTRSSTSSTGATTTRSTSTTTRGPTSTVPAPTSTPTLISGWNFIRAVAAPNFHKYLQSEVPGTASDGVLGATVSAAQFQITSGQIVQYGNGLYLNVEPPADSTAKKLRVFWATTPDTLGKFEFSGDTVLWTSPTVKRQATNAWLVCPDAAGHLDLYLNLGAYSYMTPAGCADQTIHGYTGPYPNE